MPRKSSVHFKPVSNVRFAVSHSERTDLSEPEYLLPKEYQLHNVIIEGSLSESELATLFIHQKLGMTGQAKARGSSPFWEGVVVLGDTDSKAQSENLQAWKVAYEKATSHKVLHMSIHLDEGYIDTAGKPQYNPHAHVIVSRMDGKNRVIKLERKELAAVQDLTAIALKMERGSTLAERRGKRGRKHVGHREYREQANEARLELDVEKSRTARIQKLFSDDTPIISGLKKELEQSKAQAAQQATEIAQLNEQYRLDRDALKASGIATQKDYQALKKAHEIEVADLKKELATALEEAAKVPLLESKVAQLTIENEALKAQEAPKSKNLPIPYAHPEKSLLERLRASLEAFVQWVKGESGQQVPVDTEQSDYVGPVVQLDDLHAVQKVGRTAYAIHELKNLDSVPSAGDTKTEIQYRGGFGYVKGREVDKDGRGG
jgi:hypothetical protein